MMDRYLEPNKSFLRLYDEYKKYGNLIVGYDFDDTVYDFHKLGHEYTQVVKLLKGLKSIGCKLYCWTANPNLEFVKNYLQENEIPFDGINESPVNLGHNTRKPYFNALLDDRAGLETVYRDLDLLVSLIKKERDV